MKRLIDIGFQDVGEWKAQGNGISVTLTKLSDAKNILYAFVADDEVLYVGKTTQKLKDRIRRYQNPDPTQSTNVKGNRLILELAKAGKNVKIFALPDNGLLHFGCFHLNLAAGLEDSIIKILGPKWNGMGKQD